ncbi:MAG: TIGR03560 family F420-dependent LLM class oxidoreductase [Conexivisphaerales archaeon]
MAEFGVIVPQGWRLDLPEAEQTSQFDMIRSATQQAEKLGYHSAWFFDHFVTYPRVEKRSCFEAWTLLSSLSVLTKKIRLGTLVSCNLYRNPALLAKMSSVVDVISHGRLEMGIGAGWYEEDFVRYGYSLPKPYQRIGALDEALQIMKEMWKNGEATFEGKYYRVKAALNYPMPVQKPWPKLTVGGAGEKLMLRVVAKHADRWNSSGSPEFMKQRLEVLKEHCSKVGRRFEDIEKSYWGLISVRKSREEALERAKKMPTSSSWQDFQKRNGVGTPQEVAEFLNQYVDLGISHFFVYIEDSLNLETMRLFAEEVIPRVG